MPLVTVNEQNLDQEHICCSISDKKGENGVALKKAWMKERFADGLVFQKLDVRGKVMIEYLPAEQAWCPIEATGYMHINCFWVSGQYAGQGYANTLLDACIEDAKAKGKCGLTVVSSEKKHSFLSDPGFLKHKGFVPIDTAQPYFVLYYLPFSKDAAAPQFRTCAKEGKIAELGMTLYYSNQCPFAEKYALLIADLAVQAGKEIKLLKVKNTQDAQNAPTVFPTYSFFDNGTLITNEILSEKKFLKYLEEHKI